MTRARDDAQGKKKRLRTSLKPGLLSMYHLGLATIFKVLELKIKKVLKARTEHGVGDIRGCFGIGEKVIEVRINISGSRDVELSRNCCRLVLEDGDPD
ncbi:hypothetical protein LIER_02805 [Lithospermum erythrorhizon]|uniref:Uncharacterized protein n=1 Tax=Lithospermum erythrorhizon TaxID=34254 RepID=A0AAV3NSC9_LITER